MRGFSRSLLTAAGSLFLLSLTDDSAAQDAAQEAEIRLDATLEKKLIDNLRLVVNPQMRTVGWNPERYLVTAGLKYKPIDYVSFRSGFRFDFEEKHPELEYGYRFEAAVAGHLPLGDFEPTARINYNYGFGPTRSKKHTLRYQLALEYSIPKSDFSVNAFGEAFHVLNIGAVERMRYGLDVQYRFQKTKNIAQSVGLGYMLDYYLTEPLNAHIAQLSYKIVF